MHRVSWGSAWLPVLAALTILLTGCPPPRHVTAYNASGSDVVLQLHERRLPWKAGTTLRITTDPDDEVPTDVGLGELLGQAREDGARYFVIYLETPDCVRRYPLEIWEYEWNDHHQARVQLQPDGTLYAVPHGEKFPARRFGHATKPQQ